MKDVREAPLRVAVRAQAWGHTLRTRLDDVRGEMASHGDRGDGPIPTVIIILATITGALVIAGGLAALYARYNSKITGP
ncbi:hypothetical protein [Streptomyces sp. NPDC020681]|uniref:hypothetical protein n=1 Tax=Streptomyces sp. NPDC020681 TaxID=3365083 RepID=UPI00378EF984